MGVRQADRVRRERLAPVAGLERRHRHRRRRPTRNCRRSRRRRSKRRCRARAAVADSRDRRAGEAGDVLAGARPAAASGHADRRRRAVPRRRLDRHRSACHYRGGGGEREQSGGRGDGVGRVNCPTADSQSSQGESRRTTESGSRFVRSKLRRLVTSTRDLRDRFCEVGSCWQFARVDCREHQGNAISHRPLPGNRPQGKEPPVVRGAAGAQPAGGDCRTST